MRTRKVAILAAVLAGLSIVTVAWLGLRSDSPVESTAPRLATDLTDPVARGAYLALAGNCRGCHTERGGSDYAGGRAIATSFGVFYAPNITPDPATGIGRWSEGDFWQALHNGKRPDGAPLYPVFPYTHFTKLTREDVGAIYAYLKSVPAVSKANVDHNLQFPFDQRWLLVAWRALYFRPGTYAAIETADPRWNRGAYLVQGLGHCGACHDARNALGAPHAQNPAAGGIVLHWYAPALDASSEAGVAGWTEDDVAALLRTGINNHASTLGPMADVVYNSLQFLREEDVRAMAAYLRAIPDRSERTPAPERRQTTEKRDAVDQRGAGEYADYCAGCHGKNGEGQLPAVRALAGNRAVTMTSNVNAIRIVLHGGYAPGTTGNPQPFGMPPFSGTLSDQQIADVLSYTRSAWGNTAAPVSSHEVTLQRGDILW